MKKFNFCVLWFAFVFVFFSCNGLQTIDSNEGSTDSQKINLIASNAELLIKQNEILSNLNTSARSATFDTSSILSDSELSDDDIEELTSFSTSPSSYITETIDYNEKGSDENLNLIYSIYNEATEDEVMSNMESVSSEMERIIKNQFQNFIIALILLPAVQLMLMAVLVLKNYIFFKMKAMIPVQGLLHLQPIYLGLPLLDILVIVQLQLQVPVVINGEFSHG